MVVQETHLKQVLIVRHKKQGLVQITPTRELLVVTVLTIPVRPVRVGVIPLSNGMARIGKHVELVG